MDAEVLAVFIPIVFLVGLFTAISLNIYFKYKARGAAADHTTGESVEAWCKAEAMARTAASRSVTLRWGGFLAGAGIGAIAGMSIGRSRGMWEFLGSFHWRYYDSSSMLYSDNDTQVMLCVLFILACAIVAGGVFMAGVWFLERALDGKKYKSNN